MQQNPVTMEEEERAEALKVTTAVRPELGF
jgi:hypothetical protein